MRNVKTKKWFAWFPVKTEEGQWAFWEYIIKQEEGYGNWYADMHLPPKIKYYKNENNKTN
jgi:hypothetical protein